jgi:hypothetical protein
MPTFSGATVTVTGGTAGRASIEVDGRRVSLSPEGIGGVLREKDGAKKLNKALAAALGLPSTK